MHPFNRAIVGEASFGWLDGFAYRLLLSFCWMPSPMTSTGQKMCHPGLSAGRSFYIAEYLAQLRSEVRSQVLQIFATSLVLLAKSASQRIERALRGF